MALLTGGPGLPLAPGWPRKPFSPCQRVERRMKDEQGGEALPCIPRSDMGPSSPCTHLLSRQALEEKSKRTLSRSSCPFRPHTLGIEAPTGFPGSPGSPRGPGGPASPCRGTGVTNRSLSPVTLCWCILHQPHQYLLSLGPWSPRSALGSVLALGDMERCHRVLHRVT